MALSTRSIALIGVGVAIVAGLTYVAIREEPVPVDLAAVTRGPLEITINADGQTKVRDIYEVASPIMGTAMRSPVSAGDPVIADETVVAIVRPPSAGLLDERSRLQAEAALRETIAAQQVAIADLEQANEAQIFAQSQFDRTQTLVSKGVASISRLESDTQRLHLADAALAAAQARIEMAQSAVGRAEAALLAPAPAETAPDSCCIELVAPSDGVILTVAAISQRPVGIGTPLVTIGDPRQLELVADILSNDAVRLAPGALAYVERWGGADALLARLDRIDPKAHTKISALGIEEQRVDAYFSLTSPAEDRPGLGHGYSVFLKIVEWRADDVVQIPLSSVFRSGEDWAVFIAQDGLATKRIVTLGRRNSQMSEVLSGLEPGEMVITHPSDSIATGVTLVERSSL